MIFGKFTFEKFLNFQKNFKKYKLDYKNIKEFFFFKVVELILILKTIF